LRPNNLCDFHKPRQPGEAVVPLHFIAHLGGGGVIAFDTRREKLAADTGAALGKARANWHDFRVR